MPVYEYECSKCGDRFDVLQRMDDPILNCCKHCRGDLKKLFSPVGIVFKGSGFYATDNRKSNCAKSVSKTTETNASETKPSSADSACSSCEKKSSSAECEK